jgi:NADPH2:quinone reductase
MKAVAYRHCRPLSEPDALEDVVLPAPPVPRGRDLRVRVEAVSVNPVDAKLRAKADPGGEPRVLGFDGAGVVESAGPDCTLFRPGDRVVWAGVPNRPGSNAELQLVDERIVGRMARSLSFAAAAALPLTTLTAYEALFDRLRIPRATLRQGEAVLILGGAGGVGSMAVQLAARLTGLSVIATASRPESAAWCRELGAQHVLDHAGDVVAQAKALGLSVPYIFSTTQTARHWPALCEILAPQGMICAIDEAPGLDIARLRAKSAGFHWEGMFARALFHTPDMARQHDILNELADLLEAGALRSTLTRNLGRICAASLLAGHALVEEGRMIGKAVAEGWPD